MKNPKKYQYLLTVEERKDGRFDVSVSSPLGLSVCYDLDHEKLPIALTNIITIELCDAFGRRDEQE